MPFPCLGKWGYPSRKAPFQDSMGVTARALSERYTGGGLVDFFDLEGGVDFVVAVGGVRDPGAGDTDFVAGLGREDKRLVLGDDLDVERAVVVRAVDVVDEALVGLA